MPRILLMQKAAPSAERGGREERSGRGEENVHTAVMCLAKEEGENKGTFGVLGMAEL